MWDGSWKATTMIFTLVSVSSRPRIDVTTMQPTRKNETCWLQKATSISRPHQCTAISMPRVTGSFLPTRSNMIFMVHMNIFHTQYRLKKWPSTLKYLPWSVRAHRCRSCMFRKSCTSRNSWRDSSSSALISSRSWPMSEGGPNRAEGWGGGGGEVEEPEWIRLIGWCRRTRTNQIITYFRRSMIVGPRCWSCPRCLVSFVVSCSAFCRWQCVSFWPGSCPWWAKAVAQALSHRFVKRAEWNRPCSCMDNWRHRNRTGSPSR